MVAEFSAVERSIIEVAELGIPLIEPSGGDLARLQWLPEGLELCNQHGLYSTISLSGSEAESRLTDWGEGWLELPGILRLSFDGGETSHNRERGEGSFGATEAVLEAAVRVRGQKPTLIVFTLVPSIGGNINLIQFECILALARKYNVKVNLNPVFGTFFTGRMDDCKRGWTNLSVDEWDALVWLWGQPEVLPQSRRKLAYALEGGNDITEPSCRASQAIVAISTDSKLIIHCYPSPYGNVPITEVGGLREAMASPERQHPPHRPGTIQNFCDGCCAWCGLVLGWHHNQGHSISEWKDIVLGI